jgi:hypothetical protein
MVIDSREAEVVEGSGTKRVEDSRCGCAGFNRSGRDCVEQALEFGFGHGSRERNAEKAPVSLNFM